MYTHRNYKMPTKSWHIKHENKREVCTPTHTLTKWMVLCQRQIVPSRGRAGFRSLAVISLGCFPACQIYNVLTHHPLQMSLLSPHWRQIAHFGLIVHWVQQRLVFGETVVFPRLSGQRSDVQKYSSCRHFQILYFCPVKERTFCFLKVFQNL